MKKILAIHDLSCFGRCALTVVIPTLSAMGHQVVPLPTALLSTHTGGFDDLHFHDLGDDMRQVVSHFERLELKFDAIYSGFLGSARQLELVEYIIKHFGQGTGVPVVVDPVMGDDGSLYSTYNDELVAGMGRLCRLADVITPNLTEACFLAGRPQPGLLRDETEVRSLAEQLCREISERCGVRRIVITGLCTEGTVTNACFDGSESGELSCVTAQRLPRSFPGTGEVFTSVLVGMLAHGGTLPEAVRVAEGFTYETILASQSSPEPTRNGVLLEGQLGRLTRFADQ